MEEIGAGALSLPSESDEQKAKHFDKGMRRGIAVGSGQLQWSSEGMAGNYGCEDISLRDFVDNGDPVITAAAASECHKNDLIQRQRNPVGRDVVLDVVRDALAEGLNGEAE